MAANDTNIVVVTGGVVADPEMKYTPKGTAVMNFSLGINAAGNTLNDSGYFKVVLWGALAESAAEDLKKGVRVEVVGSLQHRSWKAEDGSNRYSVEIVARSYRSFAKREGTEAPTAAAAATGGELPDPFA